ncbi:MAG TPA: START domain-containing protein [Pseudomonadota bacterium]|nr:START domain-containing protein [Pseudomonadota bacterium]
MLFSISSVRGLTVAALLILGPLAGSPEGVGAAYADSLPVLAAADSPAGWQPFKVKRGVAVERRPVQGSRLFEYRASVTAPVSPEAVINHMWRFVSEGRSPIIKQRKVLKQEPTELLMYDQVKTPVVSDRDYTLLVRKISDTSGHRYQMTFETANQLGPPVDPKHVRIPAIRGRWLIEPEGAGGSRLTYQSFSEPGGSIPAFMIHGAQLDQIVHDVEGLLQRLSGLPKAP